MRTRLAFEFPSTHWWLVTGSAAGTPTERRAALAALLEQYLRPLRLYLVRGRKIPVSKAEELLQSFVLSKVLEQDLLASADRSRGKFRTFLLASLNRFIADEFRHRQRQKRGGGVRI